MDRTRPIMVAAVVLLAALAGCIGDGGDEIDAMAVDGTDLDGAVGDVKSGLDGGTEAAAEAASMFGPDDVIERPDWQLGQWFGYHVFFGRDDNEGIHYNAAVVEDRGSTWLLATDNQEAAKYEAVFDFPFFGEFRSADLSTTMEGQPFKWYDWPLSATTTWTAPLDVGAMVGGQPRVVDVTYEVTYNPSVRTADGQFPGLDVVGRTAEGNLTVEYDYVPALGWFGHMFIYDPDSGGNDWVVHVMTMGSGTGWEGTYYVDEATAVIEHEDNVGLNPDEPTSPVVEPAPHTVGEVSEGATHVLGYAWSYAFAGGHATRLTDPEGTTYDMPVVGPDFGFSFVFLELPAVPGEWEVVSAGAGAAAGGGAYLWEVTEQAFEFTLDA